MPVARHIQTSLSAGEFDPLLWSREDVTFFYNSARIIENAVPLPQGGAKRREGWRFRSLQRGPVSIVGLGGATITAANGGTVGNLTDGNPATTFTTTTPVGTTTAYEVLRIDFGAAQALSMLDARRLQLVDLPSAMRTATLSLQTSADGSTWATAKALSVGNAAYDRRFAAPPDQLLGSARYWRVILDNPTGEDFDQGKVRLTQIEARLEAGYSSGGTVGQFSIHRLTATVEDEYILMLTAGCCDIFKGETGEWVACASIPHDDDQARRVKNAPNLDTVIFYHPDQPPWIVQRLGSDVDWRSNALEFETVVEFPFNDEDVSGGVNEIQFIRFDDMSSGHKLLVEFNGQSSPEVVWTTNEATNAAALEAAIEALDDISSVSVTVDEGTGANANLNIEFTGEDGKRPWAILVINILSGDGTARISRKQFGRRDFDLLWSPTRGYPRCGTFYQGRHWMGGFRARPDVIVASRAGAIFDFKEDADPVPSSPIVVAPNIDDQVTVQNLYPGRHLQIFTSSAELFVPNEPISIDNIALKVTTRHGSSADTTPVDVQGGTMFVDRNGRALREYLFTDTEQSYSAEPVSLLAGHLMAQPRSLVLRRARDVDEPTLLLAANTGTDRDGNRVPATMVVVDRAQQVTGFCRVKTQGVPLDFATTQGGDAFAVVERELTGPRWNYLEQFADAFMSDCSVSIAGSGNVVDVSAFPWLEGQDVEVHGDGLPLGAFTVESGLIELGIKSFSASAEVGLKQVPRIVLHPYKGRGESSPTMQNMRIFRALLQLERTGEVAITAAAGGRPRQIALANFDSGVMDPTLEECLFSGSRRIGGLGRWQKEPTIEITQIEPMPFLLRSITYDVRF